MDTAELRAKALAARRFEHEEGGWTLTLLTPSRRDAMQLAHERNIRLDDVRVVTSGAALLYYALVDRFVVGWSGLRVRDVVAGSDDPTPLPWSPEAVACWIDAHADMALRIGRLLFDRAIDRAESIEAAAKN